MLDGLLRDFGVSSAEGNTARCEDYAAQLCARAHDVALLGVLSGDDAAIEAVRRGIAQFPQVLANCEYDVLVHGRITPLILAFDLIHDRLPQAERKAFADWLIRTQVRDIMAQRRPHYYKEAGRNLVFGKPLAAVHAALALRGEPGVGRLDRELKELAHWLEASINCAIASDGYPEEDSGYGTAFLCFLWQAADALRRAGVFDALAACPRLARTGRAILHFVQPWGNNIINTGDGSDRWDHREYILPRLAQETDDPTLLWLFFRSREFPNEVAFGRERHVPATAISLIHLGAITAPVAPARAKTPTQFRDRRRGIVSFRSGWRPDDTLVVLDGSQRCSASQGHAHASCGHFDLSALGEYFAIDTGRYNMDQEEHNVALVDGKAGHSNEGDWCMVRHDGVLLDYAPGELADFAAVDSSHQHNCYWARRWLGLVKGSSKTRDNGTPAYVWTVDDINKANDVREYWWALNTSPLNTIRVGRDRATIRGGRHGNMLDCSFALPHPKSYPVPHTLTVASDLKRSGSTNYIADPDGRAQELASPEHMEHHSAFVRPRLLAKVRGLNGRFMSIMLPRRRGERAVKVKRIASLDSSIAVRITFPAVEDTLIFAYEHCMLEAGDVNGRGQWCVVRRARESGRLVGYELGNGWRLSAGRRRLV